MITPSIAAGLVSLALVQQAAGGPSSQATRALQLGQWRAAAEALRADLQRAPEDPDLLAHLGLAYYQLGLYSDAEAAFRNAAGSAWYDQQGVGAHAATLRALGRHDELGPLRQAQILEADSESATVTALLAAADDAIAAGDLELALDWADQALALRPTSPNAHAWLADIHQRRGASDDAGFHLWMSEREGYSARRSAELRVRWALDEGALPEALTLVEENRQGRRRNATLAVLHARVYRELGWLDEADAVFDRQYVHFGERRDYLVERGLLRIAQGDHTAACILLERAGELYPLHSEPGRLIDEHGCGPQGTGR
jgi:tetratricopeptide (TPR) repeat protein